MKNVNTVTDLIEELSRILDERNYEELEEASRLVDGWIIDNHTKVVLTAMIESIDNAITQMEDF